MILSQSKGRSFLGVIGWLINIEKLPVDKQNDAVLKEEVLNVGEKELVLSQKKEVVTSEERVIKEPKTAAQIQIGEINKSNYL